MIYNNLIIPLEACMIEQEQAVKVENRKLYIKPEIVQELELETRAGSPVPGGFNPIFPFLSDKKQD
jgi:hypothetical protein